jgi:hypothetical protein
MAAVCTYLEGEGLVAADWATGNISVMVMLTHQGIREAEEEVQD